MRGSEEGERRLRWRGRGGEEKKEEEEEEKGFAVAMETDLSMCL